MTTTTWLAFRPLDTVMVRDGRAFDAGANARATATTPPPSTLGGAVTAAVGGEIAGYLRGPVVTREGRSLFAAPQDLVTDEKIVRRLEVIGRGESSGVWDIDEPAKLTHALVGDGRPLSRWVTGGGLGDWLAGDVLQGTAVPDRWAADNLWDAPWHDERRIGIARQWDGDHVGTAEPGMLYAMTQLRPDDGVAFCVACEHSGPITTLTTDMVRLGGRGRLAEVSIADSRFAPLPRQPDIFPGGRLAVYLVTPALLGEVRWHPAEATLSALALSGPQPIATASRRAQSFNASRRLDWAIPAGTVFYLTFADADAAGDWAARHRDRLLPGARTDKIVNSGFGTFLVGRW